MKIRSTMITMTAVLAVAVLAPSVASAVNFRGTRAQWNADAFATGTETVGDVTTHTFTWHDARNWMYQAPDDLWYRGDEEIPAIGAVGWNGQLAIHDYGVRFTNAFNTFGVNTKINIEMTEYINHINSNYTYPQPTGPKDDYNMPRITLTVSETGHFDFVPGYNNYNDFVNYGAINLDIAGKWNSWSRGFDMHDTHITLRGEGIFEYTTDLDAVRENLFAAINSGNFTNVDGAGIAGTHIASLIAGTGLTVEELIMTGRLVEDYDSGIGYLVLDPTRGTNTRHAFFAIPEPGTIALLGLAGLAMLIRRRFVK